MNKLLKKKEYDRLRAKKLYEDYKIRRVDVMKKLGGKCYICEKIAVKGFNLHHVEYHPEESNYPRNSKAMSTRFKRLKEAEGYPERFKLLCPSCHGKLELVKSSLETANDRFIELLFI